MKRACKNCSLEKECADSAASWFFLFIGLVATLAVRLVNIVIGVSEFWAKAFWYIGIIGFTIFFLYKFRQDLSIKRKLGETGLEEKLRSGDVLAEEEKALIRGFVCALRSKKDTINYFFIFFTSFLALVIAIWQDFF